MSKQVVHSPWDGHVVGVAAEAGWNEVNSALQAATDAFPSWRNSSREERRRMLRAAAALIADHRDDLSRLMADEIGKPLSAGRSELDRCAITLRLSADLLEEPEWTPIDIASDPRSADYLVDAARIPRGPIMAITPYNWPFNLAAHKLGPALAAGCTVVVKGSGQASLCSLALGRVFHEAGFPSGVVNFINCPAALAQRACLDPRIKKVSFTGSPEVGWKLKELLPRKPITLELGGNAFILFDESGSIEKLLANLAVSAYGYAGQVCISAQNLLVHESRIGEVTERVKALTESIPTGDPMQNGVLCGPLISESAAKAVEVKLVEAVKSGAEIIVGGGREGAMIQPTLVLNPPLECSAFAQEIFGPVLTMRSFSNLKEGILTVNRSSYAIHTSLFTDSTDSETMAWNKLETAGLIVNDCPNIRFDSMPYGGIKDSGWGREGVRYAYDEMTEWRCRVRRKPFRDTQ